MVTGGARGIGLAFARACAGDGMGVVLCDVAEESLAVAVGALEDDGATVLGVAADVRDPVGMTGLFDINWITRDAESGIFIGRHDLYGKGIASEAIRLRTAYAWSELRLRRVHNWIGLRNRGSRRANEKAGYRQMGRYPRSWFRSGQWHEEWLGEIFAPGQEPPGWV